MIDSSKNLVDQIKKLPASPGVYLFKDDQGQIMYIGKAKNLKKRGSQYVQRLGIDIKVDAIFSSSVTVDYLLTQTELEALLLEAKLIQSHQPKCNVLLKSGQPFLYLMISVASLPELKIVRNQKHKGTYFGPFLEKGSARKVYDFLIKTFRLKICKKKIEKGCLYYHMGLCSGSCRPDFDKAAYLERLELARASLKQGHKKFLAELVQQIAEHNALLEFEKSRELYRYYQAFERVFESLDRKPTDIENVARKDIWILTPDHTLLSVFSERDSVLKKKQMFHFPFGIDAVGQDTLQEYFLSFYRTFSAPATILVNFDLGSETEVYQSFLQKWHDKDYEITIMHPTQGHAASLIRLATIHAQQQQERLTALPQALRVLLQLPQAPHTIDCFDISHTQGMAMVGSCIRFIDGQPDKNNFRRFHIKTVHQQDDYASLREVVSRRYRDLADIPDVILIDGGKGQLNAVSDILPDAEFVSLAKREETIHSKRFYEGKVLDKKSYAAQVLIALRDYAHHFAVSFHRQTKRLDSDL